MNDRLDEAVRTALRDIIAAAPAAEQSPTPVYVIDEINGGHGRRTYLLAAAVVVIAVGVIGLVATATRHTGTNDPTAPSTSEGRNRPNGEITDPHAIDFSPWLADAPEWPGFQPDYLVFDVAALQGWTKLNESGGHEIGDGWSYTWTSNLRDPDGHEFSVSISDSLRNGSVATGTAVAVGGAIGTAGDEGVSWPVDISHTAKVVEVATTDTERAIALARRLTTTTIPRLTAGQVGGAPELTVDPTAAFAGTIDGVAWSASGTPESRTFIVDGTVSASYGIAVDHRLSIAPVEIRQFGNNDLCVFISGYLPDRDTTARIVLSDATRISLPTQPLNDGEYWFAACVPYALDVTSVEIESTSAEPVLHRLNWPMLIPSLGELATDTDLPDNRLAEQYAAPPGAPPGVNLCGTLLTDQTRMVASGPRADGNRLELSATPTSNGKTLVVLLQLRHNGASLGGAGGCGDRVQPAVWASAAVDSVDGKTKGNVDVFGRTEPSAARARIIFASGKVVIADVQTDGYFVASLIDSPSDYYNVLKVEAID